MSLNYQTMNEKDLGAGIDQFSPENQIKAGFSERLLNIDPLPEGQLRSRVGYQGYCGYIPIRVQSITYSTGSGFNIDLTLDGSLELSSLASQPLVIYGKVSQNTTATGASGGDFSTTDSAHWYSTFLSNPRYSLVGTSTVSIPESEHQLGTYYAFVGFAESTSTSDRSNELLLPDVLTINKTSFQVDLTSTAPEPTEAFIFTAAKTASAGEVYIDDTQALTSAGLTYSILAASHQLNNFNIIPKVYIETATLVEEIIPDTVTVSSIGTVTFTFATDRVASSTDLIFILSSVDAANSKDGTANPESSVTVTIPDISNPFAFVACYVETITLSGDYELVLPSDIVYNEAAQTLSVTFFNPFTAVVSPFDPGSRNFRVYYEFGEVQANHLKVQGSVLTGTAYTDSAPQLTIWGINHADAYGMNRQDHEGWVNHIDGYRTTATERLVSGLGGNLFDARLRAEIGSQYLLSTYYPNIRARVSTTRNLAPVFISNFDYSLLDPLDSVWRSAGYIKADTIVGNWASCVAAAYDSGTGTVAYTLSTPTKTEVGTLSSIITSSDELVVQGMSYSRLNGTFSIVSVTSTATTITIKVTNPTIAESDWDETGALGQAAIFTDSFSSISASPFLADDVLLSENIADTSIISVVKALSTTTWVRGITERTVLAQGLRINGQRTNNVVPLRDSSAVASVTNLVSGDMLEVTDLGRQLRVVSVNPIADQTVSITGDGLQATITLTGSITTDVNDTSRFSAGQSITILQTTNYNQTFEIVEVLSATELLVTSEATTTETGVLLGYTIEVDESLEFFDPTDNSIAWAPYGRWVPIEAPSTDDDLPKSTYISYFDAAGYTDQSILRSTTVADNLYLTNNSDEVIKYDGTNLYRAGLPRWQAGLFLSRTDIGTGALGTDVLSAYTAVNTTTNTITVSKSPTLFTVGQNYEIVSAGSNPYYKVTVTAIDTTAGTIKVTGDLTTIAATGSIYELLAYNYYFRLNMIDANQNIIASAPIGSSNDFVLEIGKLSNVQIKSAGFPALDNYDYERIELEIYRTTGSQVVSGVYKRIVNLPLGFDNSNGYVIFTDQTLDLYLSESNDIDITSRLLPSPEIGTGWDQPMRAKYVTSASNRLLLANLKDYPQLNMTLRKTDPGAFTITDLQSKTWLFRKDNTDTGTTTNMVDRVALTWLSDSTADTVVSITAVARTSTAGNVVASTDTVTTSAVHGFVTNNRIKFTSVGGATGIDTTTIYYVTVLTTTSFKLKLTETGNYVDILTNNTGSATLEQYDAVTLTLTTPQTKSAGEWIYLYFTQASTFGSRKQFYTGWYQLTTAAVASAALRINAWNQGTGSFTNPPSKALLSPTALAVPILLASIASDDYNYGQLNGHDDVSPIETIAMRRLANAINSVMRQTSVLITGQEAFVPWMISDAGNEFSTGQLLVRQPKTIDTTLEVVIPSFTTLAVYNDGLLREPGSSVSASALLFPSRVIMSYTNYPEIFDSPRETLQTFSDSIVDVNSADGQEITGIIPFFGDSAFGAAQNSGVVVVFKTNSIYLLDVTSRTIQRIESYGMGCGAPFSIAPTKNGIIFANTSGIYKLGFDMKVSFVGKYLDRIWKEEVNRDQLAILAGHHSPLTRTYKLSIVAVNETEPSGVVTYNHTREEYSELGLGSWTEYDNFQAIGWANLTTNEYWASVAGQVFSSRLIGDETDYRDDASPISREIMLRGMNFGDESIRKAIISFAAHYRTRVDTDSTKIYIATNLQTVFDELDSFQLLYPTTSDGLSDLGKTKIISLRHSVSRRKFVTLQIKYTNPAIDEPFELCGLDFRISGLQQFGTKEAIDTTR